ncbi:putative cytochrome c biosynthesis protein [Capsicum chinense]|nr:putative cytochrome c biosynthesis protein [Capsicum chinense]
MGFDGGLKNPPTDALRLIILDNACILCITVAIGTELDDAYSPDTINSSYLGKEVHDPWAFYLHAELLRQAFTHCGKFPTTTSCRSLGQVSVPVWLIILLEQLLIITLAGTRRSHCSLEGKRILHVARDDKERALSINKQWIDRALGIALFFSPFLTVSSNPCIQNFFVCTELLEESNPVPQDPISAIHPPCIYAGDIASAMGHSLNLFNALEEEEQQTKRALGISSFHATMLSHYLFVEAGMRPYSLYLVLFQLDISDVVFTSAWHLVIQREWVIHRAGNLITTVKPTPASILSKCGTGSFHGNTYIRRFNDGRNSNNNSDNGNKACGKASQSKKPIRNLCFSFMMMNGTAIPCSKTFDGERTAVTESAALDAFLLPDICGVVIGRAITLNSFFDMRIIEFFIAQERESISLRPDFQKWDSEKVEFSNPL